MHHIYIQVHKDPNHEWIPCEYRVDEKAIEKIVREWIPKMKTPFEEEEIQEEEHDREVWKEALKKSKE